MTEFNFIINDTNFSLNQSNYQKQIPKIFDEIRSLNNYWVKPTPTSHFLDAYARDFISELKKIILVHCTSISNFEGFLRELKKLLKIDAIIFNSNSFPLSDEDSEKSKIINTFTLKVEELLAIAIEAYQKEYPSFLEVGIPNEYLIRLILFIKDGDLYHENNTPTLILQPYLRWINRFNAENIDKYRSKLQMSQVLKAQQDIENKTIVYELTKHWEDKKKSHFWIFVFLLLLICGLILAGCFVLRSWIITGNSAFDSCCEQMSFANLLYGAVVHWGFQYKVILLVIWFAAIGQLIQLIKSQWHLINDASERMAIIDTYQTFANNKILGDTGRFMDVLLQSVFRASDDGLLKDAKTTFPSSLSDLASKIEK